jgi:hypothetical protein
MAIEKHRKGCLERWKIKILCEIQTAYSPKGHMVSSRILTKIKTKTFWLKNNMVSEKSVSNIYVRLFKCQVVQWEGEIMPSVNFILGQPERKSIKEKSYPKPVALWEGEGVPNPPIGPTGHPVTYYANAQIFSARTSRDYEQTVGRLYRGYVDD